MKQLNIVNDTKNAFISLDTEQICREMEPIIQFCLNQYPTFLNKYRDEMYNSAIVALLENINSYDASKGKPTYFIRFIKASINQFIAHGVFNFSSYDKYRDYVKISKYYPDVDESSLTDDAYTDITGKTGLGRLAINTAIRDAQIAGKIPHIDLDFKKTNTVFTNCSFSYDIEKEELNDAIHTAMDGLNEDELEFVYDMCGFNNRPVLSEKALKKKYNFSQLEYDQYLSSIIRNLKGSRKLRRYIGRKHLI